MRIDNNLRGLLDLQNATSRTSARQQVDQFRSKNEDCAELSTDGLSISALSAKAMAAPEIRTDRVNSLRDQIASGTYQPNPRQIASAMIENLLAR